MSKLKEEEKAALKVAAEAVKPVLERLMQVRGNLDRRISRLRSILEAAEHKTYKIDTESKREKPSRRGQVSEHVRIILKEGGIYSEPQLRRKLEERFNVRYERSAVYSALNRGAMSGEYQNMVGNWASIAEDLQTKKTPTNDVVTNNTEVDDNGV